MDNPKRRELMPYMELVSRASQIARVNQALGTNVIDLDSLPVDFVECVLIWSMPKDA